MTMVKKCMVLGVALLMMVSLLNGCDLFMVNSNEYDSEEYEMSEENTGYFYDEEKPALKSDGITAAVNELYYTKGGYLCVNMTLGNGTGKDTGLDSLEIAIYNGDTEELIAGGFSDDISEEFIIADGRYEEYTIYIQPDDVSISNDTLSVISYEVTATATAV